MNRFRRGGSIYEWSDGGRCCISGLSMPCLSCHRARRDKKCTRFVGCCGLTGYLRNCVLQPALFQQPSGRPLRISLRTSPSRKRADHATRVPPARQVVSAVSRMTVARVPLQFFSAALFLDDPRLSEVSRKKTVSRGRVC